MKKIAKWLENYWYHYKWVTIVVAFFAVVIIIGVVQMTDKEEYDTNVMYAGPVILSAQGQDAIMSALQTVMPDDRNEDGDKTILLYGYTVLSDEQIEQKKAEAIEDEDTLFYDPSLRTNALSEITTLLGMGEVSVCFMDPFVYEKYNDNDMFVRIEDVVGYLPEDAYDDCAIYLKNTDFGKYFTAFDALPDDTLICVRKLSYLDGERGNKEAIEIHEYSVQMFKNIISFVSPQS